MGVDRGNLSNNTLQVSLSMKKTWENKTANFAMNDDNKEDCPHKTWQSMTV